jgi:hypothetical protein
MILLSYFPSLALRFAQCLRMEATPEPFHSSPIMVEAKLPSFFSQGDLQSRSPEAICKVSDPESAERNGCA